MRSFIVFAALVAAVAQVSAAHVPHVPHRGRHVEVARELSEGSSIKLARQASTGLRRSRRCPAKSPTSGLTSTQVSPTSVTRSRPVSVPPKETETETKPSSSSTEEPVSRPSSPPSSSPSSSSASTPPKPKPTTKTTQAPPVNGGQNQTSTSTRTTQNNGGGAVPTRTQNGAAPTATRTSAADPWLKSLSEPLNYAAHSFFTSPKHGDVTFYAQGQTACGDVYSDRTLTAAISQLSYDAWPGADGATNRNPGCGPFVTGRYFLSPSNETVPGSSHTVIGGDGLINCAAGEQCHRPLTATITNPRNGAKVTVGVVDRCAGCSGEDIDLSPAAFLKLTRPELDLGGIPTSELMLEALKDHYGRIPMDWKYDSNQRFGPVQSV